MSDSAPPGSTPLWALGTAAAHEVPAVPPPEVLEALDRAARILGDLDRRQIGLALVHDEHSGAVRVSVTDEDGCVRDELSGAELLDVLAGGPADADW
jgi:hypothetical protein